MEGNDVKLLAEDSHRDSCKSNWWMSSTYFPSSTLCYRIAVTEYSKFLSARGKCDIWEKGFKSK